MSYPGPEQEEWMNAPLGNRTDPQIAARITDMTETRIYRGFIAQHDMGDATDVLFLTGVSDPLAEAIEDDMRAFGRYLSVRYFIADAERSREELDESLVRQIIGAGEAEFHHRYSEITGYLWTDEEIRVGGHDLLDELTGCIGKFLHLEIVYSKDDPRV